MSKVLEYWGQVRQIQLCVSIDQPERLLTHGGLREGHRNLVDITSSCALVFPGVDRRNCGMSHFSPSLPLGETGRELYGGNRGYDET